MAWMKIFAEEPDKATLSAFKDNYAQNPLNNMAYEAKEGLQVESFNVPWTKRLSSQRTPCPCPL